MALNRRHDSRLDALIQQAAEDVKRVNPHIGADQQPLSEAEYAEIEHGRQELEHIWDEIERQRGGPLTEELGAQAVDEDRGE